MPGENPESFVAYSFPRGPKVFLNSFITHQGEQTGENQGTKSENQLEPFSAQFASYVAEAEMMTDLTKPINHRINNLRLRLFSQLLVQDPLCSCDRLALGCYRAALADSSIDDGVLASRLPNRLSRFVARNVHEEMVEVARFGFVCFAEIHHT